MAFSRCDETKKKAEDASGKSIIVFDSNQTRRIGWIDKENEEGREIQATDEGFDFLLRSLVCFFLLFFGIRLLKNANEVAFSNSGWWAIISSVPYYAQEKWRKIDIIVSREKYQWIIERISFFEIKILFVSNTKYKLF